MSDVWRFAYTSSHRIPHYITALLHWHGHSDITWVILSAMYFHFGFVLHWFNTAFSAPGTPERADRDLSTHHVFHSLHHTTIHHNITDRTKTRRDKKGVAKMLIRRHVLKETDGQQYGSTWKTSLANEQVCFDTCNRQMFSFTLEPWRYVEVRLYPTLSNLSPGSSGACLNYRNDNKRLHV